MNEHGLTSAEKILSAHSDTSVRADDFAIIRVDGSMANDAGAPFVIRAFREMGGKELWNPEKVSLVIDHAVPASNAQISNLHKLMREFSEQMGCRLYDAGEGICHELMIENELVGPGEVFVGADSHTCTYGAVGAFAIGVGANDLAAVWKTGKTWVKVPRSIRVILKGELGPGVAAKDVILALIKRVGVNGATYQALEFLGPGVEKLNQERKLTIANMSTEMGAKAGIFPLEDPTGEYWPDEDAIYHETIELDISRLRPQIAKPGSPENVVDLEEVVGQRVDLIFIGSCANGRLEDLREAARILEGNRVHRHTRLVIAPASRRVLIEAMKEGIMDTLIEAGGILLPPGCGPCAGTHQGIPADGEIVLSTANRNFPGRMGNINASIFLSSPGVAAAAACAGEIIDPAELYS